MQKIIESIAKKINEIISVKKDMKLWKIHEQMFGINQACS